MNSQRELSMFDTCFEPSPELFNTLLLNKIQKQIVYLVILLRFSNAGGPKSGQTLGQDAMVLY